MSESKRVKMKCEVCGHTANPILNDSCTPELKCPSCAMGEMRFVDPPPAIIDDRVPSDPAPEVLDEDPEHELEQEAEEEHPGDPPPEE